MTLSDLDLTIDQLRQLIHANRENDAISLIEKLEESARKHTDVMRIKSIAHSSAGGDISEAYAILRELVTRPDSSIEDLYWAGQRAAEFCDYKDAEAFLTSAIDRSKKEDNSYYLNCALLLRAYVRCHLRKYLEAREDLEGIAEDDTEIFWSSRLGHISKENLVHHLSGSRPLPTRSATPCSCRKGQNSDNERE